jgi:hypothetical protein
MPWGRMEGVDVQSQVSLTSALVGVNGELRAPAGLSLVRGPRYPRGAQTQPPTALGCQLPHSSMIYTFWGSYAKLCTMNRYTSILHRDFDPCTSGAKGNHFKVKNGAFWDVTPCGSCKNRRFWETWSLLHQGWQESVNQEQHKLQLAIPNFFAAYVDC